MANTVYDWSKVSRETLGRYASACLNYDQHATDESSNEVAASREACQAEALVPPLRARAEADAEIGGIVREYILDVGSGSALGSMQRDRQKLLALAAEPTAPDAPPVIDAEFPEADPEACSCEESERLKASVRELEADRDHFKGIWQVEYQRTLRALEHQATAESEARALREQCNRQEHGFARRESALQGELAALQARIEKAVAVLSTGQCRNCCPEALRFLRA